MTCNSLPVVAKKGTFWRRSGPQPREPFGISLSLFSGVLFRTARSRQGRAVVGRGGPGACGADRPNMIAEEGKGGAKGWRNVVRQNGNPRSPPPTSATILTEETVEWKYVSFPKC